MKRFMGMMPSNEITIEKAYKDKYGLSVTITAGPHGWTVIWADGGTNYKDNNDTDINNFNEAYKLAEEKLGKLTLVNNDESREVEC